MGFEYTSMDTLNYESEICHLTLQLFNHNFATPDTLPGAFYGRRLRGKGQAGFLNHVMKRKKSPEDNVSIFLQHRQWYGSWDHFALLPFGLVGVVGENPTQQ